MPRFVVLHHCLPASSDRTDHFDLMLERGETLRTWALETWPIGAGSVTADRLPDHRPDYLDYEGSVSANRGEVSRVASGHYQVISESADQLTICLRESCPNPEAAESPEGQGGITLVLRRLPQREDDQRWTCGLLD